MIQLAAPWMLLAFAVPLLARLLPPRPAPGLAMILPDGIRGAGVRGAGPDGRRGQVLLMIVWGLLALALAGPQRLDLVEDRSASGRDILIALDMSGSMATPDFALDGQTTTRLAAVKRVAESFIEARRGDRMGLVVFADRAYVAAPLTHDLPAVTRALHEAEIGISGRSTNISEGLGLALKRMLAGDAESQVIVLLSDGRDTADLVDAAEVGKLAAEREVRIHSVALGPDDLETRPAARDAVDVATLRAIADASGGQTFRVRSTRDLQAMAEALDRLEPNPSSRPPVAVARALWPGPAAAALLLLGVVLWRRLA
ncbi:VWA domain-containing protein [uncultured Paracoccus sp.]|uniref:VWA domain-containing protein n=1 Tax=uncultured Paracoccus sp. TaxID=189685 RepID=UPI00261FF8E7|nr:VWA domain-containing protein [uncultured Paracoccus sp.]